MTSLFFRAVLTLTATPVLAAVLTAPAAQADHDNNTGVLNNSRLNNSLVANVYTMSTSLRSCSRQRSGTPTT